MPRKPNNTCDVCSKPFYRRPCQSHWEKGYCSRDCYKVANALAPKECPQCKTMFKPKSSKHQHCGRSCAAKASRTGWSTTPNGSRRNESEARLVMLKGLFNFTSCMIVGCNYSRIYDIHRFIEGKDGGSYIVGNMFAICPNHHKEIHRHVVEVAIINDHTLQITKDNLA